MNTTTSMPMNSGESRFVVLVDTYGAASRLAPAFQAAGYIPIRVQSTLGVPAVYRGRPDRFPFIADIVHRGDLADTVNALLPFDPVAVIPGCEPGVELADALSEALNPLTGAPSNGTALSSARRNKFEMIERIKSQGLQGAQQILVESEEQLREWHIRLGGMAILKPLRSSSNDGVTWCASPDDSVRAFRRLNGRENINSEASDGVVAQEYLVGTEYLVNTMSRDGRHHVTDVWKTHRITANGVADLMVACQIMPAAGEVQDKLIPYAFDVLDALDIGHGAGHVEIKTTPTGPSLVEVGARMAGQDIPGFAALAIGESQVDWMVDAYVRPQRFLQRCGVPYRLQRSFAWAKMVAPRSGTLVSYRGLQAIKELDSFRDIQFHVHPGQQLQKTVDDSTYPVTTTLMHEVDDILLRDLWTLRYIDGEHFYELKGNAS